MNYFQAYLPSLDEAIVAAWDAQVAEAADAPWLAQALATKSAELFPRFADAYAQLRHLPRGARRALQHRLARSCDVAIPAEWQRKLAGSLAGAALLLALGQGAAHALDIPLTTNKPGILADGLCSLIEAITNANNDDQSVSTDCPAGSGADRITLQANTTITLTSGPYLYFGENGVPLITTAITIEGSGGSKIVRKASAPAFRIFYVTQTGDLTLRNVTVSGGKMPSFGGGGVSNFGSLTIENSTISGNRAYAGGGVYNDNNAVATITNSTFSGNRSPYGAAILNDYFATMTIDNSTISGNKSSYLGGGVFVAADSTVTINNSTISGNKAKYAGGIFNDGYANPAAHLGTVIVNNSTIASNKGRYGGGILNEGTLDLNRSLISGNKGRFGREVYHFASYGGSVTVSNYNIFGVSNSSGLSNLSPGPTDIVPAVPLGKIISPLAANGGPTMTRALPDNSPAIDIIPTADPACTGNDQRGAGFPRPSAPGTKCDIGAFEK